MLFTFIFNQIVANIAHFDVLGNYVLKYLTCLRKKYLSMLRQQFKKYIVLFYILNYLIIITYRGIKNCVSQLTPFTPKFHCIVLIKIRFTIRRIFKWNPQSALHLVCTMLTYSQYIMARSDLPMEHLQINKWQPHRTFVKKLNFMCFTIS